MTDAAEIQRQRLLATVDVFERTIVVGDFSSSDGTVTRRIATAADVVQMFTPDQKQAVSWFVMDPTAHRFGISPDGMRMAMVVRKSARTRLVFSYAKRKKIITAVLPNLLAILGGDKEGWKTIGKVYAFWGKQLRADSQLYLPPFPNLFRGGGVCMGTVAVKRFAKLSALEFFEKAYIQSNFSDHFADEAMKEESSFKTVFELLRRCPFAKMKQHLREAGTYGELIDGSL